MEQVDRDRWAAALAATLRAERGVARLSQAEVERRTGITRTSYRLYEEGKRQPDMVQLAVIAEAFGVSPLRLVREVERRAKQP